MELTRFWRAQHKGTDIEVQWTGMRLSGGCTLRLLVDGRLQAESRSFQNEIRLNGDTGHGPVAVYFRGGLLHNRCSISVDGAVLTDRAQPWNPLGLATVLTLPCVSLCFLLLYGFWRGSHGGRSGKSVPLDLGPLYFLCAFAASAVYGYWLGGYARRHSWDRMQVKSRAGIGPFAAGILIGAIFWPLQFFWGIHHPEAFPALLGFLLGGSLVTWIVMRRACPGESVWG